MSFLVFLTPEYKIDDVLPTFYVRTKIMVAYRKLWLFGLVPTAYAPVGRAQDERASSFVGATTTFQFPPSGVTATVPDPNFPDANVVGFPGPTPSSCLSGR
jgi:hypothetical protein